MRPTKAMRIESNPAIDAATSSNAASAASPSAHHNRAPDGLALRTASGPPALRALAPLENRPVVLLQCIARPLLAGPPREVVQDLFRLQQVSQTLRGSVESDVLLSSTYRTLRLLTQAAQDFARSTSDLPPDFMAWHCAPILEFLGPTQRDSLVEAVLNAPDGKQQAAAIHALGVGLAHLRPSQRAALVAAALRLPYSQDRARAIGGFGPALAHLELPQRDELVVAATSLPPDARGKLQAVFGLSRGLASLTKPQGEDLVAAALTLTSEHDRAQAIGSFGSVLGSLNEAQRTLLLDAALQLPDDLKGTAIADLGTGIHYLTPSQRSTWTDAVIHRPPGPAKTLAINALGSGLAHLRPSQLDTLADEAIRLPNPADRSTALHGLGPGMEYLSPDRQAALVTAAVSLQSEDLKASAIAGLARGLAHLPPARRGELMDAALSLRQSKSKHIVAGGLAAVLAQLNPAERATLVNDATGIHSIYRHWAIAELGKQSRHLTLPQREALVNAARQIDYVARQAEALAGLAEGAADVLRESAAAA